MPYGRYLHQRDASLFRRTVVLRRVKCGLQRQASAAASRVAQAPMRALSLSGEGGARALAARAPALRELWSLHELLKATAAARGFSLSVYGRAPAC